MFAFILRRLTPWFRNVGKRLTKAPKLYLRDSGMLHHLLDICDPDQLAAHPIRGASWEGFALEQVLALEMGADDVLGKPCPMRELLAPFGLRHRA